LSSSSGGPAHPAKKKRLAVTRTRSLTFSGAYFGPAVGTAGKGAHKATVAVVDVSTELGRSNYDLGAGPDGLRENVPFPTGSDPPGRSEGPRHRLDSDGHRDRGEERDDNDNPCRLGVT
jgi:hypothetical protein